MNVVLLLPSVTVTGAPGAAAGNSGAAVKRSDASGAAKPWSRHRACDGIHQPLRSAHPGAALAQVGHGCLQLFSREAATVLGEVGNQAQVRTCRLP
jgi:hypothetical protein